MGWRAIMQAVEGFGPAGDPTIRWLWWLRWTAVVGQSLTVILVTRLFGVALPLMEVGAVIGFAAFTNGMLLLIPARWANRELVLVGVVALDVILLTALLHYTGGSHNPFSSFYLVHVALSAVLLPLGWTMTITVGCCVGYALLYLGTPFLPHWSDVVCGVGEGLPMELHLKGMLAAFVLTALCVAFFANRLRQTLGQREAELANARALAAKQEHFASLATLAAGAAHELGTPIGTISMAAGELARVARALPQYPELIQDAELIRSQSLRCRAILDRLQEQAGDPPRTLKLSEVWTSLRSRFPQAELEVTGEERNALVHVPTESFVQAMACLVKNALDAQAPFRLVRIQVDAVGDDIRFSVIDSGPRVSEEVRRRAGEPFFTTKPAGQGMGLGLFLVKAMAQQLCGAFRLESHAAGGTAAVLQFPKESR